MFLNAFRSALSRTFLRASGEISHAVTCFAVFAAFNELYKLKNQVKTECNGKDIYVVAAFDGDNGAAMITNVSDKKKKVKIFGAEGLVSCKKIGRKGYKAVLPEENTITLFPYETALVKFD